MLDSYLLKKENIIKDAINSKIGLKWDWAEVENRGAVISTRYDDEVFMFDGKPLVKFKKPTLKTEESGTSTLYSVSLDVSYLIMDEEFNVLH